jgi:hypothetical protein
VTVTTPGVGYVPGLLQPVVVLLRPGGFVPVDNVVGDRSSTDFGMVFGAGVNIAASDAASVYLEIRYHYIWGPEINPSEACIAHRVLPANGPMASSCRSPWGFASS